MKLSDSEGVNAVNLILSLISRLWMIARLVLVGSALMLLSGCGSIISRTVPGQGHGHQYYPGVQWDMREGAWKYIIVIDVPLSMIVDTFMLPIDAQHGPYE
ncbi:putative lipoprotein [Yersinia similis]|nr:putative lipoprotein [Yersinia similis]CNC17453.1 putative lipoprotein [Yersinia similis]CNF11908.1 putative lipoprotein [Yersinia similis]CNF98916.1 putative lipoprotein [Yersinia similis]CNI35997.1 putative lipoprotein [Yersinia similis]